MSVSPSRYRRLDICRGLAAFSVLIWHYQHFYYASSSSGPQFTARSAQPLYSFLMPFYEYGGCAVQFFWLLSGFVFAATYLQGRDIDGWTFFVRRLARLYPLHVATLTTVASLQWWSWQQVGHLQIYSFNDAYHFALNLGMIQWWGLQSGYSFNAPTWSVSVEIAIYIFFFFCIPIMRHAILPVAMGLAGLSSIMLQNGVLPSFMSCSLFFFLGAGCYGCLKQSWTGSIAVAALIALTFVPYKLTWGGNGLTPIDLSLMFSAIVLAVGALDQRRPVKTSAIDWFGQATYGSYLLHIPIQIAAITIIETSAMPRAPLLSSPIFLLSYVCIVFGSATIVYRYFELPADLRIRKMLRIQPTVNRKGLVVEQPTS